NIDRGDFVLRPQRDADLFAPIDERRPAPRFNTKLAVFAHQNALGAADGRQIEQHADVAGDAEASRVGYALPVEHQDVWFRFEFLPRFEQRRGLAEAQQSRHVREFSNTADAGGFYYQQIGQPQNDYAGVYRLRKFVVRDVRPGDRAYGPREWLQTNQTAKQFLNLDGFASRQVPAVQ